MLSHRYRAAASFLLLVASGRGQHDMIGITFTGQSVAFDSRTGSGVLLATNAERGMNAMARRGNELFTVERLVPAGSTTPVFPLGRLDSRTGDYTRVVGVPGDLRGMADHLTNDQLLYGVVDGTPDLLVTIDLATATTTPIGSTGHSGIQALTRFGQQLLAWDTTAGLLRVDTNSGLATDVNPAVGGSDTVQFLTAHHDGRLLGGRHTLFEINPASGVPTAIGPLAGGVFDVRGAEERMPLSKSFGTACGPAPLPQLTAVGGQAPGTLLGLVSGNHQPQRFGVQIVGFSHLSHQGTGLPLLLDPLLGTIGCSLFVSPELTRSGVTNGAGQLNGSFVLPPLSAQQQFFVQHAVFENAPGGIALTNAVMVKVGV